MRRKSGWIAGAVMAWTLGCGGTPALAVSEQISVSCRVAPRIEMMTSESVVAKSNLQNDYQLTETFKETDSGRINLFTLTAR